MGRTGTTRRRALAGAGAAAAAALLAGCTGSGDGSVGTRRGTDAAAAQAAALRTRSAATSSSLLDRYDAVLARHPAESARLAPLRAAVAEHVKALAAGSPSAAPSASGTGRPAVAGAKHPVSVPADPAAALSGLADAERQAAKEQSAALLDAPPELARLLASIAAACAVHQYLLSTGARR
ncbi:hypothetical protein AB0910_08015 [Streptomyces sp. NPDC047002]|uniref:hypothetical protein n=1 Tax=Streptomyces sp. NPDC047002 TaxID=3155475 RepID=UPI003453DDE1